MSENGKRFVNHVEHIPPAHEKRAERRAMQKLKQADVHDDDWDDYDLKATSQPFKKCQKLADK